MPGILSTTTDLTIYMIDNPAAVTADKLKRHAFRPIDDLNTEELAVGWTSIDAMLDTAWEGGPPEKGEWLCFALRVDKRAIPGAVFKKHYAEALKEEEAALASGEQKFISRSRKAELKEQVKLRLLPAIEPAPSIVDVAMNMHSGLLLVASSAKALLAHLEELMATSFGVTPRKRESSVDSQRILRQIYESSAQVEWNEHAYTLTDAGQVTLAGSRDDEAVQVVVKNDKASVDAGLEADLSIVKLKICMERDSEPGFAWTFSLTEALNLSGVKTPATEKPATDNDTDAAMLEKLYLLELVAGSIGKLFELK